jgi:hypothetical protein
MVYRSMGKGLRVADETVYKERLLGVGGFPFLLSVLVLLYSNQQYDVGNILTLCVCLCLHLSIRTLSLVLQHSYHLRPTPPITQLM